jgi:putative FmdB family regulatory protein
VHKKSSRNRIKVNISAGFSLCSQLFTRKNYIISRLWYGDGDFMPTYEYECDTCGLVFEEFQSITAPPLTKCKKEGCPGAVRRLISPGAGFIFKGSGFYSTDYRSENYKKAAAAEKPIPAGGAKTSESKPAGSAATSAPSGAAPAPSTGKSADHSKPAR